MPASATKSRQCASRLSPIEKRGKRCRSSTSTSRPRRCRSAEAIAPDGPAPMTTTSRRSLTTHSSRALPPERIEIEPLQRLDPHVMLESIREALRLARERRVALGARPAEALGEGLEVDVIGAGSAQTEQQVHWALEECTEQIRSYRKRCDSAEKANVDGASAVHRNPIARDDDPLAAIDTLLQHERGRRSEVGHLQQLELRGARHREHPVEVGRVPGVHEHVEPDAPVEARERAANLEVAEMRSDHETPSPNPDGLAQPRVILEDDVAVIEPPGPRVELVEDGVREGEEVPIGAAPGRREAALGGLAGDPPQVLE